MVDERQEQNQHSSSYQHQYDTRMADNVDAVVMKKMPDFLKLMEDPAYYPIPNLSCQPEL